MRDYSIKQRLVARQTEEVGFTRQVTHVSSEFILIRARRVIALFTIAFKLRARSVIRSSMRFDSDRKGPAANYADSANLRASFAIIRVIHGSAP